MKKRKKKKEKKRHGIRVPWALASWLLGVVWLYSRLSLHALHCLAYRLHGQQHPLAHVTDGWDYSSQ